MKKLLYDKYHYCKEYIKDQTNRNSIIFTAGGIVLFWSLRIYYWLVTVELPFSDMAGYNHQAHMIIKNFSYDSFDWTPFYKSVIMPTLPLMRAIQIVMFGDSLIAWQFFMAALTFSGLLWLIFEIIKATNLKWLGISLLWIVALSKSSIFWSYKISHEGPAELFIYWCLASTLFALRSRSLFSFIWLGLIYAIAIFNRPNFAFIIPIFVIQFLVSQYWLAKKDAGIAKKEAIKKAFRLILAFCFSGILIWLPWGIRSKAIYGTPWVLSTEGIWGFLWELPLEVKTDDGKVITSASALQQYLPSKFKNDYEASSYVNNIAKQWLSKHRSTYPKLVADKVWRTISDRRIYLTKVARNTLFTPILNSILIDKSIALLFLGIAGLVVLSCKYKYFYFFIVTTIIPWLSAAVLLGLPRMLEPMIPVILFGNVAWIIILFRQDFAQKALIYFQNKHKQTLKAASIVIVVIPLALISADVIRTSHQNMAFKVHSSSILRNRSFSSWSHNSNAPDGWVLGGDGRGTASLEKNNTKTGKNAVRVTKDSGGLIALYQDIEQSGNLRNKDFNFSCWVYSSKPRTAYIAIYNGTSWENTERNADSGKWERLELNATIPHNLSSDLRVHLYVAEGYAIFDDVQFIVK